MLFLYRPEGGNRSLQITSCDNKQQNSSCFKTHGTYFQKLCFSSMRKYIYISFNVLFLNLLAKAEIIGMKKILFSSKAVSVKQEHLHACIWGCTVRDRLFLISAGVETQRGFLTAVHLRWTQEAVLATWDLHPLRWVCGFPQTFNWVEGRKRTLHGRPPQEAFTVTTHGQCFSSCGDSQTVGLASCQTGQVVSASVKKKWAPMLLQGLMFHLSVFRCSPPWHSWISNSTQPLWQTSEPGPEQHPGSPSGPDPAYFGLLHCSSWETELGCADLCPHAHPKLLFYCLYPFATCVKPVCVHLLECNQQNPEPNPRYPGLAVLTHGTWETVRKAFCCGTVLIAASVLGSKQPSSTEC